MIDTNKEVIKYWFLYNISIVDKKYHKLVIMSYHSHTFTLIEEKLSYYI